MKSYTESIYHRKSRKDLYEWPVASVEVVQPGAEVSDFLEHMLGKEKPV